MGGALVVVLGAGLLWNTVGGDRDESTAANDGSGVAVRPGAPHPARPPTSPPMAMVRIGTADGPVDILEDGRRMATRTTVFEKPYPVGTRVAFRLTREGYDDEVVEITVRETGNEYLGYQLTPKRLK